MADIGGNSFIIPAVFSYDDMEIVNPRILVHQGTIIPNYLDMYVRYLTIEVLNPDGSYRNLGIDASLYAWVNDTVVVSLYLSGNETPMMVEASISQEQYANILRHIIVNFITGGVTDRARELLNSLQWSSYPRIASVVLNDPVIVSFMNSEIQPKAKRIRVIKRHVLPF